jgi:hypothetical protein
MERFTYEINKYKKGEKEFRKDLKVGEVGEMDVKRFLESKGCVFIHKTQGNDSRYDLKLKYGEIENTVEVKTDVYLNKYGKPTQNIVIEFECRGKASGINVTEANYYTTFFPFLGEIWNITSNDLRALIANNNPHVFEWSGDDGSNTRLYSFNRAKFKKHFRVHKVHAV